MRLFLMAVAVCGVMVAGCKKDELKAGALNVRVSHSTFTKGCIIVTVKDATDASRTASTQVELTPDSPNPVQIAVFRQEGWGTQLDVQAEAREVSCMGAQLNTVDSTSAQVPEKGSLDVPLAIDAVDTDGDGYVQKSQGGTDCNDALIAVNPAATETCDGVDTNCIDGESDAIDKKTWYVDADSDGYGNTEVKSCTQPSGTVALGGDCNDTEGSIRPGQSELRCDNKDDNCNSQIDEVYNVNQACSDTLACAGTYSCNAAQSGTNCIRTEAPQEWFVDEDEDGAKGKSVGLHCGPPQAGAVTPSQDCDESSVFVKQGLPDVCDRLDNDCSTVVDDNNVCGSAAWTPYTNVGTSNELNALSIYGQPSKAWVAGNKALFHVDGATITQATGGSTDCDHDWKTVWAGSLGRAFVAGSDGKLGTLVLGQNCYTTAIPSPTGKTITSIVGIESDIDRPLVYAVVSDGRIFRWTPPYGSDPQKLELLTTLPANLRAIHASDGDLNTLLTVGVSTIDAKVRAFKYLPGTDTWNPEEMDASIQGFIRGLHVLSSRFAYAVGDNGQVHERDSTGWHALQPIPQVGGPVNALDVVAYSRKAIYAVTSEGNVAFYNGSAWTTAYSGTSSNAMRCIDGPRPTRIAAVGLQGTVLNWSTEP
ncbi:MAG: hypothetical protein EOO71_07705 [Myxococcaceae bacterium]|nr:MAG: hypothetical protein EOO71_07705 [Myxococcaceae bacterium]